MGRGIQKPEPDPSEQILRLKILELVTKLPLTSSVDIPGIAQKMLDWVKNITPKSEGE